MSVQIGIMATDFPHLSIRQICEKTKAYGATMIEMVHRKNLFMDKVEQAEQALDEFGFACSINNFMADLNASGDDLAESKKVFTESIEKPLCPR